MLTNNCPPSNALKKHNTIIPFKNLGLHPRAKEVCRKVDDVQGALANYKLNAEASPLHTISS